MGAFPVFANLVVLAPVLVLDNSPRGFVNCTGIRRRRAAFHLVGELRAAALLSSSAKRRSGIDVVGADIVDFRVNSYRPREGREGDGERSVEKYRKTMRDEAPLGEDHEVAIQGVSVMGAARSREIFFFVNEREFSPNKKEEEEGG